MIETLVERRRRPGDVTAGVSSETPAAVDRATRADAAAAGAGALMLLPSLGYGGDAREIEAFYRAVAERHRPADHGLQQPQGQRRPTCCPRSIARLAEIDGVVAIKECSGDARRLAELLQRHRRASRCWWAATTGRSRASAPARPAGSPAWRTSRPRECVDAAAPRARRAARRGARDLRPHPPARPARHDGRSSCSSSRRPGPRRPPRRALPPAAARADAQRSAREVEEARGALRRGGARLRAARVFRAVDSHTEGMPTRVITGGVGPIPGASMLERKLHFEQHMDGLRLLLDARAARPRRDVRARSCSRRCARTPTGACSSSRCPAACRCAATGRSAWPRCWWRPAWSR